MLKDRPAFLASAKHSGSVTKLRCMFTTIITQSIFILVLLIFSVWEYQSHLQGHKEHESELWSTLRISSSSWPPVQQPARKVPVEGGFYADQFNVTLTLAAHNLPFKEAYRDVSKSFDGVHGMTAYNWLPSPQSFKYFQPMGNKDSWFYSAHFDHVSVHLGHPAVRILGFMRSNLINTALVCYIHTSVNLLQLPAKVRVLPDTHKTKVLPVMLTCPLQAGAIPYTVSIAPAGARALSNLIRVQHAGFLRWNFTVCYSVLHSSFDKIGQFAQSVETNRLLGAEHFFVYNFSVSARMSRLMDRYVHEGILTVLPWPLPTLETWYLAQTVALSDCLYRNRNVSRFTTCLDTDELIIPRFDRTWAEVLTRMDPKLELSPFKPVPELNNSDLQKLGLLESPPKTSKHVNKIAVFDPKNQSAAALYGAYIFQCTFFTYTHTKQWTEIKHQFNISEEEDRFINRHNISQLWYYVRNSYFYEHIQRSKYIMRPDYVDISGIHSIHTYNRKARPYYVDKIVASLHHYRAKDAEHSNVVDTSAFRFKDALMPILKSLLSIIEANKT